MRTAPDHQWTPYDETIAQLSTIVNKDKNEAYRSIRKHGQRDGFLAAINSPEVQAVVKGYRQLLNNHAETHWGSGACNFCLPLATDLAVFEARFGRPE